MKRKFKTIFLLFMIFFLIGSDTFIISPLIPSISKNLNIQAGSAGYLVTLYSIFYVICAPLLGPISDNIGRKKMLVIGMFIFSVASITTGLSKNFVLMLIARGFTGIGAAFAAPNIWAYIGDSFDYEERGKVTAIVASALSLGMIFGIPIGSFLTEAMSWNDTFYVLGIISFIIALSIFIVFPYNKVKNKGYKNNLKDVFKQKSIVYSFFITLLVAFANFGLYTFLGYWINKCFNLNVSFIGMLMIIAGIGNLIGTQLGGYLSDKYGKRKIAIIATFLMGISLILLPISSFNLIVTGIDIFLWMTSGGTAFSTIQVMITQLSKESRGTVMAINNSFMWTGSAIGSAVIGIVVNNIGFVYASLICGLSVFIASFILKHIVIK